MPPTKKRNRPPKRSRGVLGAGSVAQSSVATGKQFRNLKQLRKKRCLSPAEVGVLMKIAHDPGTDAEGLVAYTHGLAITDCETGRCGRLPGGRAKPSYTFCCYGLWQIHKDHGITQKCAADNLCNTRFAARLSKGWTDWSPWDASKDCWEPKLGDIENLLQGGGVLNDIGDWIGGAADDVTGAAEDVVQSTAGAIGDIVKFIARLFEPSFWVRVGKGILGAAMLIFGGVILMKAILGVDLGGYAEALVGSVGGQRVRGLRAGVAPSRARLSSEEAAARAGAQQEARERAKSTGEAARRKQFFSEMKEPPF